MYFKAFCFSYAYVLQSLAGKKFSSTEYLYIYNQKRIREAESGLTFSWCQHSIISLSVCLPSRRVSFWEQAARSEVNCCRAFSSWATCAVNSCSDKAIWLTISSKLFWVWNMLSSHCFQSECRACISASSSSHPLGVVFCFTAGASVSTLLRRLAPICLESISSCNGTLPW